MEGSSKWGKGREWDEEQRKGVVSKEGSGRGEQRKGEGEGERGDGERGEGSQWLREEM